jgi:hypothetical protein
MKLQEIFDQLGSGEFSQMSIGAQPAGVINEGNHGKIVNHVNLALTALFTRFNLKEGRLELALQDGQSLYKLHSSFAVNGRRTQEPVRYIIDTADERFEDDIIKVEKVLDDDEAEIPLNDASNKYSVTTPSTLTLRVPSILETQGLTVVYRAAHPKIVMGLGYFDPTRVDVELPDTHLTALLFFVASRVNNPIGMTNEFHAGNSYYAKYEAACQDLEGKGLQVDLGQTNTRAQRNGWV